MEEVEWRIREEERLAREEAQLKLLEDEEEEEEVEQQNEGQSVEEEEHIGQEELQERNEEPGKNLTSPSEAEESIDAGDGNNPPSEMAMRAAGATI